MHRRTPRVWGHGYGHAIHPGRHPHPRRNDHGSGRRRQASRCCASGRWPPGRWCEDVVFARSVGLAAIHRQQRQHHGAHSIATSGDAAAAINRSRFPSRQGRAQEGGDASPSSGRRTSAHEAARGVVARLTTADPGPTILGARSRTRSAGQCRLGDEARRLGFRFVGLAVQGSQCMASRQRVAPARR